MKLRRFGRTDLRVSPLCLGTMQFGWTADEPTSFAVMDAFAGAGGNILDTADIYGGFGDGHPGISEEIVGRWLKERRNRNRMVVATKVRGRMWEGPDGEGLGRQHIMRAVDDSLRRLQIETIDLYQCHWPDGETPVEETLGAFGDLIAAGKVRYVGVSNYTPAQLEGALGAAGGSGLPRFVSLQPHYNLVHRSEFEGPLADVCRREKLAVIPYSPLAGGFLTGKYRRNRPLPQSRRAERAKRYMTDRGLAVMEALEAAARDHGVTASAVALAWTLANPLVTAPITGANSPEQLADLLPAAGLKLNSRDLDALAAASAGL